MRNYNGHVSRTGPHPRSAKNRRSHYSKPSRIARKLARANLVPARRAVIAFLRWGAGFGIPRSKARAK